MTKEEIFAFAEKADLYLASDDSVINFAKLIAEKEREACAKACEKEKDIDGISTAKAFAEIIRARGQE
jgi:hypothetical protein